MSAKRKLDLNFFFLAVVKSILFSSGAGETFARQLQKLNYDLLLNTRFNLRIDLKMTRIV